MTQEKMSGLDKIVSGAITIGVTATLVFGLRAYSANTLAYRSLLNNDQVTANRAYERKKTDELLFALGIVFTGFIAGFGGYAYDIRDSIRKRRSN